MYFYEKLQVPVEPAKTIENELARQEQLITTLEKIIQSLNDVLIDEDKSSIYPQECSDILKMIDIIISNNSRLSVQCDILERLLYQLSQQLGSMKLI